VSDQAVPLGKIGTHVSHHARIERQQSLAAKLSTPDGSKTYVEFPASLATGEAPPLFVIGTDGKAELVNYRLRERFYVVDRIVNAAELRLGTKKQQVVHIDRVSPTAKRRGT